MDTDQRRATRAKRLRLRWSLFFWRQARKIVIGVIGTTMMLIGIAGLVLPIIPGWVLIFTGAGVLATEFAWARWVLNSAKERLALLLAQADPPTVPLIPVPRVDSTPEPPSAATITPKQH